jgi:hypothetical protein
MPRPRDTGLSDLLDSDLAARVERTVAGLHRLVALLPRMTPAAKVGTSLQLALLVEKLDGVVFCGERFGLEDSSQAPAPDEETCAASA